MKIQEYLYRTGVPKKFLRADLNDRQYFIQNFSRPECMKFENNYDVALKVVAQGLVGALILGSSGAGKSFFGAAMLKEYVRGKKKTARCTGSEIADYYFKDYQGIRDRYVLADVLFIDDIVKDINFTQANGIQVVEKIIRMRDDAGLITLYAADSQGAMKKVISEGAMSLILGTTYMFNLPNVDLRAVELKRLSKEL